MDEKRLIIDLDTVNVATKELAEVLIEASKFTKDLGFTMDESNKIRTNLQMIIK
jgi:hypothetical protein